MTTRSRSNSNLSNPNISSPRNNVIVHESPIPNTRSRGNSDVTPEPKKKINKTITSNKSLLDDFFGSTTKKEAVKKQSIVVVEEEEEEDDEDDDFFGTKQKEVVKQDYQPPLEETVIKKKEEDINVFISDDFFKEEKKKKKVIKQVPINSKITLKSSNEMKSNHLTFSINFIGNEIYHVLRQQQGEENILISPLNILNLISIPLNIITKKEKKIEMIEKLFNININGDDDINTFIKRINHLLKKYLTNLKKELKLQDYKSLNSISFFNSNINDTIEKDIKNYLLCDHLKDIHSIGELNEWFDETSDGYITSLNLKTTKDNLISNATFFKGVFKFRFDSKKTFYSNFNISKNDAKKIYFMEQIGTFNYFENEMNQYISLDYGTKMKSNLSLILILNKDIMLENDTTPPSFNDIKFIQKIGKLILPKFKIFFSFQHLNEIFESYFKLFDLNFNFLLNSYLEISEEGSDFNSKSYSNVESQFYSDEEDENNNGNDQFELIINRPFQLILKDFTNDTILYRAFVKNPILLN